MSGEGLDGRMDGLRVRCVDLWRWMSIDKQGEEGEDEEDEDAEDAGGFMRVSVCVLLTD